MTWTRCFIFPQRVMRSTRGCRCLIELWINQRGVLNHLAIDSTSGFLCSIGVWFPLRLIKPSSTLSLLTLSVRDIRGRWSILKKINGKRGRCGTLSERWIPIYDHIIHNPIRPLESYPEGLAAWLEHTPSVLYEAKLSRLIPFCQLGCQLVRFISYCTGSPFNCKSTNGGITKVHFPHISASPPLTLFPYSILALLFSFPRELDSVPCFVSDSL